MKIDRFQQPLKTYTVTQPIDVYVAVATDRVTPYDSSANEASITNAKITLPKGTSIKFMGGYELANLNGNWERIIWDSSKSDYPFDQSTQYSDQYVTVPKNTLREVSYNMPISKMKVKKLSDITEKERNRNIYYKKEKIKKEKIRKEKRKKELKEKEQLENDITSDNEY
jgi:hypothetical protein